MSAKLAIERVPVDGAPREVRIAEGDLADALVRTIRRREQSALLTGLRQGESTALENAAAALDAAVERFDLAHESMLAALGTDVVDLAVEIARQILRSEIRAGHYEVEDLVRKTLAHARTGRGRCTVHLHPDDVAQIEGLNFRSGTLIEADSGVPRGSVQVETPQGLLVRDTDECLLAIAERLKQGRTQ